MKRTKKTTAGPLKNFLLSDILQANDINIGCSREFLNIFSDHFLLHREKIVAN